MANFFSADYWKALYFKAMGGQATAVDPNAMSGSFAGSASFTGTASATGSSGVDISGSFSGTSSFEGDLRKKRDGDAGPAPRKKRKQITFLAPSIEWVKENARQIFGGANAADVDRQIEAAESQLKGEPPESPPPPAAALAVIEATSIELVQSQISETPYDDEDEIIALLLAA